jgi:hypothetical protein
VEQLPVEDIEMILKFAIEGRKRVKDQLFRIDPTYASVNFEYSDSSNGRSIAVHTLEETKYPQHYYKTAQEGSGTAKPVEPNLNNEGVDESADLEELNEEELIELGEHNKLEFKSTLRWSLHADKVDTRIEHGTLKTIAAFLNTDGGTILIGVEDNGNILGIDADRFENDDKFMLHFANLVNNRIGKQYAEGDSNLLQQVWFCQPPN